MQEVVDEMQIKMNRQLSEIESFKNLFLTRATEKTVSFKLNYNSNILDCNIY